MEMSQILDENEAAKLLKMSVSYLQKNRSEVPSHKIGNRVRYLESELLEYVKAQPSKNTDDDARLD